MIWQGGLVLGVSIPKHWMTTIWLHAFPWLIKPEKIVRYRLLTGSFTKPQGPNFWDWEKTILLSKERIII